MGRIVTLIVFAWGIVFAAGVIAQEPSAFEVVSVRSTIPRLASIRLTDARVDIVHTLRWVLLTAYGINEYLPVNDHRLSAPRWLDEEYVEIHATIPPGKSLKQLPDMLRRMLIERFDLGAHLETRTIDVYNLLVGRDGIRMTEVAPLDELEKSFEQQLTQSGRPMPETQRETLEGPVRTLSIKLGTRRITSRTMYDLTQGPSGTRIVDAARMTMGELVPVLARNLDEPVVDRTGLGGVYRFRIELPPDLAVERLNLNVGIPPGKRTGPSTFKAIEGLGLTLERRPTPVQVIVVDRMNRRPTAN